MSNISKSFTVVRSFQSFSFHLHNINGINRKEDTREAKLQNMKNSNKKTVSLFDRVSTRNKC
jgi:hypothetical protein